MIADELKDLMLREHSSLVVQRAVAKAKRKARYNPIPVGYLNQIADCESISVQRPHRKEAVKRSLGLSNRN